LEPGFDGKEMEKEGNDNECQLEQVLMGVEIMGVVE
jgi:hypothetical protein